MWFPTVATINSTKLQVTAKDMLVGESGKVVSAVPTSNRQAVSRRAGVGLRSRVMVQVWPYWLVLFFLISCLPKMQEVRKVHYYNMCGIACK